MPKCCPGNPGALSVELHFRAVALCIEISHERVHIVGGYALAAFDAAMDFQFKLRQQRHDEEVAVEIGEGFLQQTDLKLRIWICLEQMCAHHCLVEIGCDLSDEQGIVCVHIWLVFPCEIRMHGVT